MKRTILAILAAAASIAASAQTPAEDVNLTDMTFVRQSFGRNFYNCGVTMSRIPLETPLFLDNSNCLVVEGGQPRLRQEEGTLVIEAGKACKSTIRAGAFHPYLCYETAFEGVGDDDEAGMSFYANDGSGAIRVTYCNGRVMAVHDVPGTKSVTLADASVPESEEVRLRVQYTGARFHVFRIKENGGAVLLFSVEADMRATSSCITHSFGVYTGLRAGNSVILTHASSALTCGTGQADPQIVQHSDGTPVIVDGRLYVCMTTRGFEKIPDSYQGVYSIGTDAFDLRLEGALFFGEGDGLMHGYHATKLVLDDKTGGWMVITVTHGGSHTLAWARSEDDLLHGIHYLECEELMFPHCNTAGHSFHTEDPDFFHDDDAQLWRLAYCAVIDGTYRTVLAESDSWNGPYRELARATTESNTGIRITTVGGRRYVLSGGKGTTFYIYDYPTLKEEGTFKQLYENGGFRGWPTIVPLPYGNYERYLWITFDRGAATGRYSYGTLYFYLGDKMWKK